MLSTQELGEMGLRMRRSSLVYRAYVTGIHLNVAGRRQRGIKNPQVQPQQENQEDDGMNHPGR